MSNFPKTCFGNSRVVLALAIRLVPAWAPCQSKQTHVSYSLPAARVAGPVSQGKCRSLAMLGLVSGPWLKNCKVPSAPETQVLDKRRRPLEFLDVF